MMWPMMRPYVEMYRGYRIAVYQQSGGLMVAMATKFHRGGWIGFNCEGPTATYVIHKAMHRIARE